MQFAESMQSAKIALKSMISREQKRVLLLNHDGELIMSGDNNTDTWPSFRY